MIKDIARRLVARVRPLRWLGAGAADRLAANHQLRIVIGPIRIQRWDTIAVDKLSFESERHQVAFSADTIQVRFRWQRSQWRRPSIAAVAITGARIRLRPMRGSHGEPSSVASAPPAAPPRGRRTDPYKGLHRLLQRYAHLIPREASCTELDVRVDGKDICKARSVSSNVVVTNPIEGETSIRCALRSGGWSIDLAQISPSPFEIERLDFDTSLRLQDHAFAIEDGSTGTFNALRFGTTFRHVIGKQSVVNATVRIEPASAEQILRSLPFVKHATIRGIEATGTLGLRSRLSFDLRDSRHHEFSAKLIDDDFAVTSTGTSDLAYLKGPFHHDVYDNGVLVRRIVVDASNPDFVPIGDLPELLLKTIFLTEDPDFYTHRGINEANIGWAIVANVRYKTFRRGGSTITMQLARNLFLGHKKHLARKTEEMILAWLMEDYFQISKNRILELYFNIIELAPNVYGIAEGCRYYFGKRPRDLTLEEILVLSYLIPRPKYFPEAVLLQTMAVKSGLRRHFAVYGDLLLQGGHIDEARLRGLAKEVRFAGSLGTLAFA